MDVRKIIKDAMILFVITLVSGLLLGLAYEVTKGPIEVRELEQKKRLIRVYFLRPKRL